MPKIALMGKKEKIRLKERWKIEEKVFDKRTLITLSSILEKGMLDSIDYVISTGKEANVYRATSGQEYVALKIYKVETSPFSRKLPYLEGDPRFPKKKRTPRELVKLFASKEFKNLKIAEKAGVPAPLPLFHKDNIVVMSFLGKEGKAYPKIHKTNVDEKDFYDIVDSIRKLYKHGLVHADLSEYNILKGDRPYLIDFGQGVVLEHPKAHEFLIRDINNIVRFFKRKIGINKSVGDVIEYVKGIS